MSKNTIECPACSFPNALVKENAKGALSVSCEKCGFQGFARSPKSTAALKHRLGVDAPAAPDPAKPAPAGDDLPDWIRKL